MGIGGLAGTDGADQQVQGSAGAHWGLQEGRAAPNADGDAGPRHRGVARLAEHDVG